MNLSKQKKDNTQQELPYSYHTFIYTFTYSTEGYKEIKGEESQWEKIKNVEDILKSDEENEEEWSAYNSVCYFTPKARNAIFNTQNDNTSVVYRYKMPEGKTLKYVITLYEKEEKISLPVEEIKLTLFPKIKVGIISINLVNYDAEKKDEISRIKRVAQINEWGRRLFFPNKSGKGDNQKNSYIETKGLGIYAMNENGEMEEIISTDFAQQYEQNKRNKNSIDIKPQFIDDLLGTAIKNKYHIASFSSVFDDRMFTCSLVRDDFISAEMKTYNQEEGEYVCYLPNQMISNKNIETSSLLYGYVFIDSDLEYCSCQNKIFRKELLKKHIYDRWINYGTLYGFTEYSMTCIMDENEGSFHIVCKSFLTQYVEIVKLCLVQRAAINVIETDIVNSCKIIQPDQSASIDADQISKIWEKYIIFQNELYLPEVTFQEQGVEIYAFLKKFLKLEELNEQIGTELDNLHELTELMEDKRKAMNEEKTADTMNFFSILLGVAALADVLGLLDRVLVAKETDKYGPYFIINFFSADVIRIIEIVVSLFFLLIVIFTAISMVKGIARKKGKKKRWQIMNCGLMKAVTSRMNNKKGRKS